MLPLRSFSESIWARSVQSGASQVRLEDVTRRPIRTRPTLLTTETRWLAHDGASSIPSVRAAANEGLSALDATALGTHLHDEHPNAMDWSVYSIPTVGAVPPVPSMPRRSRCAID